MSFNLLFHDCLCNVVHMFQLYDYEEFSVVLVF